MASEIEKRTMSLREFIEDLKVELPEAEELIGLAPLGIPEKTWIKFCGFGATESTIDNFAYCIAKRIPSQLARLKDNERETLLQSARELFKVMSAKADELGEKVDFDRLAMVYNP
jgi:hypothetical protein